MQQETIFKDENLLDINTSSFTNDQKKGATLLSIHCILSQISTIDKQIEFNQSIIVELENGKKRLLDEFARILKLAQET